MWAGICEAAVEWEGKRQEEMERLRNGKSESHGERGLNLRPDGNEGCYRTSPAPC